MAQLDVYKTITHMKLLDAIKNQGRPFEIPDCSRDDLPQFFVDMGYKVGVEIGVLKGEYSEKLCRAGLKLYAIDPWQDYLDYNDFGPQEKFDLIYEQTRQRLSVYPNCTVVRKASMDAVADFADGSLDFVYIDANHQLKYVIEDLVEWAKKVRPGGIVAGHDYIRVRTTSKWVLCHVMYALPAYTGAYGINNWYVLGRKDTLPGEKRDRERSWMFFKS